jgi:putative transposase
MRPVRQRELVDGMRRDWDVSIRRACRVLEVDTSTYHYKSRRRGQAGVEARIREICETRVRYGYRRVHVLLCREGWSINMKLNPQDLQRVGSSIAEQDAEATG